MSGICAYCHQWLPDCTCAGFIAAEPAPVLNLTTDISTAQMGPRQEFNSEIEVPTHLLIFSPAAGIALDGECMEGDNYASAPTVKNRIEPAGAASPPSAAASIFCSLRDCPMCEEFRVERAMQLRDRP